MGSAQVRKQPETMKDTQNPLERLQAIGFRRVGSWVIDQERLAPVLEDCASSTHVLYAFVIDGEPVYVGKTIQTLKQRLYGYANPGPTQTTNIRGNKNIAGSLSRGSSVEIFALPDHGLLCFGGFRLNLAAALEDSIVSSLRPVWNISGMKKS